MTLVEDFEAGRIDNASFRHADHVRVAFELLATHPFEVALARFAAALRRMACAAGAPDKYHMTITVAFLAAIAERRAISPDASWEEFAETNRDVLDRALVRRWYSASDLDSPIARSTFVMPRVGFDRRER